MKIKLDLTEQEYRALKAALIDGWNFILYDKIKTAVARDTADDGPEVEILRGY